MDGGVVVYKGHGNVRSPGNRRTQQTVLIECRCLPQADIDDVGRDFDLHICLEQVGRKQLILRRPAELVVAQVSVIGLPDHVVVGVTHLLGKAQLVAGLLQLRQVAGGDFDGDGFLRSRQGRPQYPAVIRRFQLRCTHDRLDGFLHIIVKLLALLADSD
ncbi:hypothetical protein D3C73_989250 [compost metagenome]